jgi:hypothetical protein
MSHQLVFPYTTQLVSLFTTALATRNINSARTLKPGTKWFLLGVVLANILLQVMTFAHYTFLIHGDLWQFDFSFSILWVILCGVAMLVIQVNLLILNLFKPFSSSITPQKIKIARGFVISGFIAFVLICVSKLWLGMSWQTEQFAGIGFMALCMIYDNWQAFFLIAIVNNPDSPNGKNENVQFKVKKTILWNTLIVGFDWIIFGVVLYHIFVADDSQKFILSQIANGITSIHSSCLVLLYLKLKTMVSQVRPPNLEDLPKLLMVIVDQPVDLADTRIIIPE